jgi:hypothetical protein
MADDMAALPEAQERDTAFEEWRQAVAAWQSAMNRPMAATLPEGMAALRMMRAGDELFALLRSRGGQQEQLPERCEGCGGGGVLQLGGYPDQHGYEREGPCPDCDGTGKATAAHRGSDTALSEDVRDRIAGRLVNARRIVATFSWSVAARNIADQYIEDVSALLSLRPQQDGELPENRKRIYAAFAVLFGSILRIASFDARYQDGSVANFGADHFARQLADHLATKCAAASTPSPAASPSIPEPSEGLTRSECESCHATGTVYRFHSGATRCLSCSHQVSGVVDFGSTPKEE